MAGSQNKPILKSDESDEARLDVAAMAVCRAGRVVSHAEVTKWLNSWGTADELPCPKPEPR
jgi:predicted transcriptional regulator